MIDYEPLPPVTDPLAALDPTAPVLFDHLDSNEAARIEFSFGDPDAAFAAPTASSRAPTG